MHDCKCYNKSKNRKKLVFLFSKEFLDENIDEMLDRMVDTMSNLDQIERANLIHRDKYRENRITQEIAYSLLSDDHICKMLNYSRSQTIFNATHQPREVDCG